MSREGEKSQESAPKIEVNASMIRLRASREKAAVRYQNKRKGVGEGRGCAKVGEDNGEGMDEPQGRGGKHRRRKILGSEEGAIIRESSAKSRGRANTTSPRAVQGQRRRAKARAT